MKQSNAFLASIMLIGFFILAIYATTAIDLSSKKEKDEQSGKMMTVLTSPTVDFADPILGPLDAKLTIVEFGNYMCSACADMDATIKSILKEYSGDVRLAWKDVADETVQMGSGEASMAARCAWQQGAFWEYHDMLLENQDQIIGSNFGLMAAELGLDLDEFQSCMSDKLTLPLIERTTEEALRLRLTSVPTLFIGERRIEGNISQSQLSAIVRIELDKASKSKPENEESADTTVTR